MEYKRFLADFPKLNHWPLDADGRYYLVMRPLRLWDAEENTYIKFRSMKEAWDCVFDGVQSVGNALSGVESFELALDGGRGAGSGTGQLREFRFTSATDGRGGGESVRSPEHWPAEANVRIKVKTEQNAINYFSRQYRNADHEYGYAIDRNGYVHNIKEGGAHSVGIHGTKGQFILHNHPSGGAFSKGDMQVMARGPESGIAAVGKNGTYYFRKSGGHFRGAAFERAMLRARPKGKNYDEAISKWLTDNQKKFGYRFEFRKLKK